MGKLLLLPAKNITQILWFIHEMSAEGQCVLCGKAGEEKKDDGTATICSPCYRERNVVSCARCGESHIVDMGAFEVHKGIAIHTYLNVNEDGPIGIVVGACRYCDPSERLEEVPFQELTLEKHILNTKP